MRYYLLPLLLLFAAIPTVAAEKGGHSTFLPQNAHAPLKNENGRKVECPPFSPFVNDSTLAIIKIDPTKLDIDDVGKALGAYRGLLPADPVQAIQKLQKEMDLPKNTDLFDVVSTITGGKPLYIILSGCHFHLEEQTVVICFEHPKVTDAEMGKFFGNPKGKIPKEEKEKAIASKHLVHALTEILQIQHTDVISRGAHGKTDYIFAYLPPKLSSPPSEKRSVELFSDLWPATARPDLEAALKQGADAPINVAVGLPKYVTETLTILRPSKKLDVGTIVEQGLRWASFTLNFKPASCNLTIQAKSPEAAAACEKLIEHCVTKGFKLSATPSEEPANQASLAILRNLITTKIVGNQLQYSTSPDKLEEAYKNTWQLAIKPITQERQRQVCVNNMKQIGIAMHNYADAHKNFPPAYTVDENGKPLHSWRVLLLPYLEQYKLYKNIKLDEPWDSDHNKQFHKTVINVYQSGHDLPPGQTCYSVVVGSETMFPPPSEKKKIAFRDLRDGTSNTAMVVERAKTKSVCWMKPTDLSFNELLKDNPTQKLGNLHGNVWHLLFGDASCHTLTKKPDRDTLKIILTINGGESVDFNKLK